MADVPPQPSSTPAFQRLAAGVQRQLYRMGWTSLRPIQTEAIHAFLGTESHLLITADTASGKTEAAFLPVLSSISDASRGSVRAMYVGPLKALINDQFGRLEELCAFLDTPVHRWHGDVAGARKSDLLKEPSGVLLITPESLESLLINRTAHLGQLFGGLRVVVIDEVHAFLENERGLHLSSLLARVRRCRSEAQSPLRMIGLSATIGDVRTAQQYLAADDPDRVAVISDDGSSKEIQFRVHAYQKADESLDPASAADGDAEGEDDAQLRVMGAIATDLVEHCRAHSNLVFANSKGDIELYADLSNERCRAEGLPEAFLVHHGSLSKDVREDTEQTMKDGRSMTVICSSTLEMGIDIGAVRMVGQIGAPWSVASLKQRMGRSGRRDGEPRRLRAYAVCGVVGRDKDPVSQLPLDLLQTIAVCELMLQKWVEPPVPPKLDLSTLTHQVISTIAQLGAVMPAQLYNGLCKDGPFRAVSAALFAALLRRLGAVDVVEQDAGGKLILGLQGERLRARRDFYAAFASRAEFSIVNGERTLGTLPIQSVPKVGEHIVFAARRWRVSDIDAVRLILYVEPARRRQRPRFPGSPGEVHHRVREEMRLVLATQTQFIYLDRTADETLRFARALGLASDLARRRLIPMGGERCLWLTWTGTGAQRTLLALLAAQGIEATDLDIGCECRASPGRLATFLRDAAQASADPLALAEHVAPKQLRKYDDLLDDSLLNQCIAADRLDCMCALNVVRETSIGAV